MESVIEKQLKKIKRDAQERQVLAQAKQEGLLYADLEIYAINIKALSFITYEEAQKSLVIPINIQLKKISLAVVHPHASETQRVISQLLSQGYTLDIYLVSEYGFLHALKIYNSLLKQQEGISDQINVETSLIKELFQRLTTLDSIKNEIDLFSRDTSTSHMLDVFLVGAFLHNASDIHFETKKDFIRVRYRIDGLLHDVTTTFSYDYYKAFISRIKLLAHLKIDVRTTPQEGKISTTLDVHSINLRVYIIPSDFGETMVIRLLRSDSLSLSLSSLGLRKDDLDIVSQELRKPHGMILNTGPTGSGKTTTLYSFLLEKRSLDIKIITIEDPIEYALPGIEQTQVEKNGSYTFINGLQALLRQDPDVILIGEIRDTHTAHIALEAALTGHLVFSTVHANSASGVIPRLLSFDVRPTSIGPSLNVIIAQRLVRKLCTYCRIKREVDVALKEKINRFLSQLPHRVTVSQYQHFEVYDAGSCERCHQTGYSGRIGLFELLPVGKEIEQLIEQQSSEAELHRFALEQGMVTLQNDGLLKVLSGITSFAELERVTGDIVWG